MADPLLDRYPIPDDLRVYVRDADLIVQHEVEDYTSLTLNLVLNDVGSWEIGLSEASAAVPFLSPDTNPGGGIVVHNQSGQIIFSGPICSWGQSGSDASGEYDVITVAGTSDDIWLAGRLVYPDWEHDPRAAEQAFYKTTAETAEGQMHSLVSRNLGALALADRKLEHFTQGTNGGRGPSRNRQYRYEYLLEALQALSTNSGDATLEEPLGDPALKLNFRLIQVGDGLVFQTFAPGVDPGQIVFSKDNKSLRSYEYQETAPIATYVIEGAALGEIDSDDPNVIKVLGREVFVYTKDDFHWPRRMERFVDVGIIDTTEADTPTEVQDLQDAADESALSEFNQNGGQVAITIVPRDIEDQVFGVDYQLGDLVTVQLPRRTFVERVREVAITYDADGGKQVTVSIGTENGGYQRRTPGHYKRLNTIQGFINYLKTRQVKSA